MKNILILLLSLIITLGCQNKKDIIQSFILNKDDYNLIKNIHESSIDQMDIYKINIKNKETANSIISKMEVAYIDDQEYFKKMIAKKFNKDDFDGYKLYRQDSKIKDTYCDSSPCAIYFLYNKELSIAYLQFIKF